MATKKEPAYKSHELAEIFPLHEGKPLHELADDIKEHGQKEPIVLYQKKILDGRRRELACYRAEVKPKFRQFGSRKEDGKDPLSFVLAINLHRRHLSDQERAMVAAKLANVPRGGDRKSDSAKIKPPGGGLIIEESAEKLNVSKRSAERASKIIKNGSKALQEAVEAKAVTLTDAAAIADEPKDVQAEAVKAVQQGKADTLQEAVREIGDEKEEEEILDAVGFKVPAKAIDAFEDARKVGETCRDLDKLIGRIEELGKGAAGRLMHVTSTVQTLRTVRKSIWGARPTHVCPYCQGKREACECCKGQGWTNTLYYSQAPKEKREKMESK